MTAAPTPGSGNQPWTDRLAPMVPVAAQLSGERSNLRPTAGAILDTADSNPVLQGVVIELE
jgi:hypothetical protein